MNGSATHKGAKQSKHQPVDVHRVLPNIPGDLFWEINKPGTEFEQHVVGIVVVRADGAIGYVNSCFAGLLADLPANMVGKPILDLTLEEDKTAIAEVLKDTLSGKRRFAQFETSIIQKSGKTVDILVNASMALFEGQPAVLGAVIDISARKQAEAALRTSESKYANALKIDEVADWEYDVLADRFTFNDSFYRIFRTTAKEVGGYTMSSADYAMRFVHADDRGIVGAEVKAAIEAKDPNFSGTLEHRMLYGDGTSGYISVRFFIAKDDAGRTIKTYGINQDITQRKKAEDEIASLSRFPLENPNPVLRFSPDGTLIFANASAQPLLNVWGCEVGQLLPDDLAAISSDVHSSGVNKTLELACKDQVFLITLSSNPAAKFVNVYGLDITANKHAEEALRASEAEFRTLAESMPQIVWITRPDGWNIYFNQQWMDYTGLTVEESMGHGWNKPFHPDDRQSAWDAWQDATKNSGIYSIESRLRRADGTYRWWLVRGVPLLDDDGNILKWFGTCTDIHALKIAELSLADSELKLRTALSNMSQGLVMLDAEGGLMLFNDRYAEILGVPPDQILPGMTVPELMALRTSNTGVRDVDPEGTFARSENVRRNGEEGAFIQTLSDGRSLAVALRQMPDGGVVATFEDVTERIRTEERITHLAHYDTLTDLPNRVLFREQLKQALKWVHRGEKVAVLYLDLDHFKTVNDSLGHPVGDELLKAVSGRLQACLRGTDSIARLGGDEFAIIQTAVKVPSDVTDLLAKIFAALGPPFDVHGHQLLANTSIGIAVAPGDGNDPDQLLKNADLAMYGAKADGRNVFRFFEPDMDARAKARRVLELDLREGIQRSEFELLYQPLVNLQDNAILGCEALLRWHHPKRGMVSPADFIPIAEETGLIVPIGEWVLRTACAQAATWPDNIKIAVNVSPVQFKNGGFVPLVINALAMSGLTPQRLELEITEAVLVHDDAAALVLLQQLRALGARISMDDFGTGYSSLSYLQRFPFDKIKIDQSFIKGVEGSVDQQSIVQAVMTIAKARNVTTTAEGVETEQQRAILRTLGCTELQGYLFSPPISAAKMTELILSHRKMDARVA